MAIELCELYILKYNHIVYTIKTRQTYGATTSLNPMTETLFITKNKSYADTNSQYTKIYINTKKEGQTTKISLSKNSGQLLYILSTQNHDNMYDYFRDNEVNVEIEQPQECEQKVKKSKQGNLFGFFQSKKN